MSRTFAPTLVRITEKSLVITPSGVKVTDSSDVRMEDEGEVDPICVSTGVDGVATCKFFQPLVMFVGGAWDVRSNLVVYFFGKYDKANQNSQDIGYVTWDRGKQLKAIALHWLMQGQKVVLVGHSMGARTAHEVSKELSNMGKEVELLVTLDPVFNGGCQPKPAKVKTWLNVHVDYGKAEKGGINSPNNIALSGDPWQNCPSADINEIFSDLSSDAHAYAEEMFMYFYSQVELVK